MKKIAVLIIILLAGISFTASGDEDIRISFTGTDNPNAVYRIFQTDLFRTLLKLNTCDGRIWMLEFNSTGKECSEKGIQEEPLVTDNNVPGRFTVYTTHNMLALILLDTVEGTAWHIRLASRPEKVEIVKIPDIQ